LESGAVGLKWSGAVGCISYLGCTGGHCKVVGWDSVSGSLVRWGVWSIPSPNIFRSGAVRCGVSSDLCASYQVVGLLSCFGIVAVISAAVSLQSTRSTQPSNAASERRSTDTVQREVHGVV